MGTLQRLSLPPPLAQWVSDVTRATSGRMPCHQKKRKYELGRQAAMTRIGPKRTHIVRCRGGNLKYRAMRLDTGNFSWGTEVSTKKCRIIDVVYNASNNELVRTNTIVKGCVVQVDGTPFRQAYEKKYGVVIGEKKSAKKGAVNELEVEGSKSVKDKVAKRRATRSLDAKLDEQFATGRVFAKISSRPGQSGRADGYILEGKELDFYMRKMAKKTKK